MFCHHAQIDIPIREIIDEPGHELSVPAGILHGLTKEIRIVRVQTQQFIRKFGLFHIFQRETDGLTVLFVVQIYEQLLTGVQLDFLCFTGERVRAVHPDGAAYTVQHLHVSRVRLHICHIPPGDRLLFVVRRVREPRIRGGKGRAVIHLFRARGPDGERLGIDDQFAGYGTDVREMFGHVLAARVKDCVSADRVF